MARNKNPGGRRSKYPTHVAPRLKEIAAWLRDGLLEAQVYKNLGIGKTTWEKYKADYPELSQLVHESRLPLVPEIESTLYKMAIGYYYTTEEARKIKDKEGNEGYQIIKLKKFKPPELGAVQFALKNWAREKYTDNPQLIELKKEELEFKKEVTKFSDW